MVQQLKQLFQCTFKLSCGLTIFLRECSDRQGVKVADLDHAAPSSENNVSIHDQKNERISLYR